MMKKSITSKIAKALLAVSAFLMLGAALSAPPASAQTTGVGDGVVNWNGWELNYGVLAGLDGLRLENVTYDDTLMMARISLPVMSVFYEIPGSEGGCGPYADQLGGTYEGIFTNEFTMDGEQWLELAIQDTIGAYIIYQSYYFSESGVMDAHIFSKALQCNIYHEHIPFWRIDFDLDGAPNDQIVRLDESGTYVTMTSEFDMPANGAANHEWYVRDSVEGSAVRLNFDDGTYNLPGEIVPETEYIENNIYARQYKGVNPEIIWQTEPTRDLGFNENEAIDDLVVWYTGFMPHSPEEGPDLWHSTGLRMELVADPLATPPTPTPAPATATPEPATPTPEPATPEPATPTPEPATPEPATPTPEPATPEPATPTPEPATPEPATPTPEPATPTPATPTPEPPAGDCIFSADLGSTAAGFAYVDDASDPVYASGAATGSGLEVLLGGVDDSDIFDMEGSWAQSCSMNAPVSVNITLDAELIQGARYESDEYSAIELNVNGVTTILASFNGDGETGSDQSTGVQNYTVEASLAAGSNDISLVCFNDKKTASNETTTCVFEAITIAPGVGPPTPTPPPGSPIALTSGVPVTGLAGAQGDQLMYVIDVPANMGSLEVVMTGSGDADLYTQFGSMPSDSSFDCRPYTDGSSDETCSITNPAAGQHFVLINGWAAFSNLTLTATHTPIDSSACVLANGVAETGLSGAQGASLYCTVEVPAGASNLSFEMTGNGDADLYTRFGSQPTLSAYDCRPYVDGTSNETCPEGTSGGLAEAGTHFVMINGWAAFSNVSITASWDMDTGSGPTVLTSGIPEVDLSGAAGSEQFFVINVPVGTPIMAVGLAGGTGDADLYVQAGSVPTESSYDCRPYLDGTNNENCEIENPTPGQYFIMVRGWADFDGTNLLAITAIPETGGEVPGTEEPN